MGWALFSIYRIVTTTAPDFSVLWLVASDFYKTANPYLNPNIYTPSGYPPFSYFFYIPLTVLPFKIAQTTFVLMSFFSIIGSVVLSLKMIFKKAGLYVFLFVLALALISFPTKFTLGMGQVNAIVLFLLLYSHLHSNDKPAFSGLLVGIAIMLKPIFGFFLFYFFLNKSWKLISYSLITVFVGFLGSMTFYGPGLWIYWIHDIVFPLLNYAGRESYYNQGFVGFISRLSSDIFLRKAAEWGIIIISTILLYVKRKKDTFLLFSQFIISLLLLDSLSWQHHFVWLIFPFVLLAKHALGNKKVWFWILLFLSYLLVSWNL